MQFREESLGFDLRDRQVREAIDRFAARVKHPAARLRFVRRCGAALAAAGRPVGPWSGRLLVLRCLLETTSADASTLDLRDRLLLGAYRRAAAARAALEPLRRRTPALGAAVAVAGMAAGLSFIPWPKAAPPDPEPEPPRAAMAAAPAILAKSAEADGGAFDRELDVWLVETDGDEELYSNGLEINNAELRHTEPLRFVALPFAPGVDPLAAFDEPDWRTRPVGIVYHTTVSDTAPPIERENRQLIRHRGRRLLQYFAEEKLYHFVIDRFGRVHRLIPERETAFHAGFSMWADAGELYVNLNDSFIGVAFEARPEALEPGAAAEVAIRPAQIAAARLLTEMLRERFGIPEANCVTHEMVSLNPVQYLIGYHTDWVGRFPFVEIGLPDNYELPLPAVAAWGFGYDSQFVDAVGGRVWSGVKRSEQLFRDEAAARDRSVEDFRRERRRDYSRLLERRRAAHAADPGPEARQTPSEN